MGAPPCLWPTSCWLLLGRVPTAACASVAEVRFRVVRARGNTTRPNAKYNQKPKVLKFSARDTGPWREASLRSEASKALCLVATHSQSFAAVPSCLDYFRSSLCLRRRSGVPRRDTLDREATCRVRWFAEQSPAHRGRPVADGGLLWPSQQRELYLLELYPLVSGGSTRERERQLAQARADWNSCHK